MGSCCWSPFRVQLTLSHSILTCTFIQQNLSQPSSVSHGRQGHHRASCMSLHLHLTVALKGRFHYVQISNGEAKTWDWRMAQQLRAFVDISEDWSSFSAHGDSQPCS